MFTWDEDITPLLQAENTLVASPCTRPATAPPSALHRQRAMAQTPAWIREMVDLEKERSVCETRVIEYQSEDTLARD